MKAKSTPTIESESLELAKLVSREQSLLAELTAVRIEKRRRLATIANLATGAEAAPSERTDSKKEQVRQFVFGLQLGSEITTAQAVESLGGSRDIISNYLSAVAGEGFLRRIGRGRYIVERKMATDEKEDE